jgi:hypothetical protein
VAAGERRLLAHIEAAATAAVTAAAPGPVDVPARGGAAVLRAVGAAVTGTARLCIGAGRGATDEAADRDVTEHAGASAGVTLYLAGSADDARERSHPRRGTVRLDHPGAHGPVCL